VTAPDLLAELDAIADQARDAQAKLRAGLAVNGATALRRIEERAKDAAAAARDRDGSRERVSA
jgi:hypothetical protein